MKQTVLNLLEVKTVLFALYLHIYYVQELPWLQLGGHIVIRFVYGKTVLIFCSEHNLL
jgi:hypothetical protein